MFCLAKQKLLIIYDNTVYWVTAFLQKYPLISARGEHQTCRNVMQNVARFADACELHLLHNGFGHCRLCFVSLAIARDTSHNTV